MTPDDIRDLATRTSAQDGVQLFDLADDLERLLKVAGAAVNWASQDECDETRSALIDATVDYEQQRLSGCTPSLPSGNSAEENSR